MNTWRIVKITTVFIMLTFNTSCSGILGPSKPNIIFVTIDALRPDHLFCYGYKRETSPNIDRLAKEGTMFTQAISQSSVTLVSAASFLTSTYPARNGITVQHLHYNKELIFPTVVELLKDNGYQTAIFLPYGKFLSRWLEKSVGYNFDYDYSQDNFLTFSRADFLTGKAIDWLEDNNKSPFFIWIHYNDPHTPYAPPPPFDSYYIEDKFYDSDKKVPLVDNLEGWGGIPPDANIDNIPEIDYYLARYDGEIRYADYWFGELVRYLKAAGLYDNSLIIVSSDHGESFGEHGLYCEHAHTLYEELIRVPLVLKFPRGFSEKAVVNRQVRLVDLMPTVLDYLDIGVPDDIDGESLLPLIQTGGRYNALYAFSKVADIDALRTEEWKLICHGQDNCELYNLQDDPLELDNVYDSGREAAKSLTIKMGEILGLVPEAGERPEADREIEGFLRSLGYIN